MPRPLRIQIPDLLRHVVARGNGKMLIFLDDNDYRHFIELLRQTVEKFDVECVNYCLMPNHYHLTLQPSLSNFSSAIQQLNGQYGQWWNRRHSNVGHVFQGRFKAQIVQHENYALAVARYVALNPVRARLVDRPEDWKWSSYAATAGLCDVPSFLAIEAALDLFGDGDRATRQQRFAEFVQARCRDRSIDDRIRSSDLVIGDPVFRHQNRGQTWV